MTLPPSRTFAGPLVLCVLDGWGHREEVQGNAILAADTPVMDRLVAEGRSGILHASGPAVGLPEGQMGNSEVGHMSIGAGRTIPQDLPRITQAIENGSLNTHPLLRDMTERLRRSKGICHVLGLISPGGVHSHQDHIVALCRILDAVGVPVRVHAFLDGRDVAPASAPVHIAAFEKAISETKDVRIASVQGRYWAMDRDRRWERTERAWQTIVSGEGDVCESALATIKRAHAADTTDEFVEPAILDGYAGIKDGDGVLCANFRADRVRQILSALLEPEFDEFAAKQPAFAAALSMASCSDSLDRRARPLFPSEQPEGTLGEIVSTAGLRQLRIAETEKYAHVTFFLNGGREEFFPGEERILVDSPKVATYDLAPEMSAEKMTNRLLDAIGKGRLDLVVTNYANPDMVGHTGDFVAAIRAVEVVDACLGRIADALQTLDGRLMVTADHGNVEEMGSPENPCTAHTTNPVPIVIHGSGGGSALRNGSLADLAPTALSLLGIECPDDMTGRSLA